MPCAGKTTMGKRLAMERGLKFVDTDGLIRERYGDIAALFERYGEAHFRAIESGIARELAAEDGLVIATGGGFLLREESRAPIASNGRVIYLRASVETLLGRLAEDDTRPLLRGNKRERLERLLSERAARYEEVADAVIDTDGKTVEEVVREVRL